MHLCVYAWAAAISHVLLHLLIIIDECLPPFPGSCSAGLICYGFMFAVIASRSCVACFNLRAPASSTEKILFPFGRLSFLSLLVLSGDSLKSAAASLYVTATCTPQQLTDCFPWAMLWNINQLKESIHAVLEPKIRCNCCCFLNFTDIEVLICGPFIHFVYVHARIILLILLFSKGKTPHPQQSH